MNALDRLLTIVSRQQIAKQRNITGEAVTNWRRRGYVPAEHWFDLADLSGGELTALDFKADFDRNHRTKAA